MSVRTKVPCAEVLTLLATVAAALPAPACHHEDDDDDEDFDPEDEPENEDYESTHYSQSAGEPKLPDPSRSDEIIDTSDEPGVTRRGRKRTSNSRRNKLRRKRRRRRKLTGPLGTGAPITSNSESAARQRVQRRHRKLSDRFFGVFGDAADDALEALSRSSAARKRSKKVERLQAFQKMGENVVASIKRPRKGAKAPHRTGLTSLAMQGVPVASRIAVGLAPEQAREAGRAGPAQQFSELLDAHMRTKGSKGKIGPEEQAATVNDFKVSCPTPSGAEGAGVHQMSRSRVEQYLLYRSHYPDILREIYAKLKNPEDLDLTTQFHRDLLAAHLGCTNVEAWIAKTVAEKKREVLFAPIPPTHFPPGPQA